MDVMEQLFGHDPSPEEVSSLIEEIFGQEGDITKIRAVTYQDWIMGTAAALVPVLMAGAAADGGVINHTLVRAISFGVILGAAAERRGWNTSIRVLDEMIPAERIDEVKREFMRLTGEDIDEGNNS